MVFVNKNLITDRTSQLARLTIATHILKGYSGKTSKSTNLQASQLYASRMAERSDIKITALPPIFFIANENVIYFLTSPRMWGIMLKY